MANWAFEHPQEALLRACSVMKTAVDMIEHGEQSVCFLDDLLIRKICRKC